MRAAVDEYANRTGQAVRTIEMRRHLGVVQVGWWYQPPGCELVT